MVDEEMGDVGDGGDGATAAAAVGGGPAGRTDGVSGGGGGAKGGEGGRNTASEVVSPRVYACMRVCAMLYIAHVLGARFSLLVFARVVDEMFR